MTVPAQREASLVTTVRLPDGRVVQTSYSISDSLNDAIHYHLGAVHKKLRREMINSNAYADQLSRLLRELGIDEDTVQIVRGGNNDQLDRFLEEAFRSLHHRLTNHAVPEVVFRNALHNQANVARLSGLSQQPKEEMANGHGNSRSRRRRRRASRQGADGRAPDGQAEGPVRRR